MNTDDGTTVSGSITISNTGNVYSAERTSKGTIVARIGDKTMVVLNPHVAATFRAGA